MKRNTTLLLLALATTLFAGTDTDNPQPVTDTPDGMDVLHATLTAPVPMLFGAVYEITHTDQHDQKKERRALLFFGVDPDDSLIRKQIISFLEPRDLKGTALLTENRMGVGENYSSKSWIYNPLFRRTKLNSISNWRNRQFGSAMSVFDGLHHDLDWFSAENQGLDTVGGRKAWKLAVQITDAQTRERSNYGRLVRWIDTESYQTLKMEIYNLKDELVKTSEATLTQVEGFWLLDHLQVKLIRDDGRTETTDVTISHYNLHPEQADFAGLFTLRALERGIPLGLQKEILKGTEQ